MAGFSPRQELLRKENARTAANAPIVAIPLTSRRLNPRFSVFSHDQDLGCVKTLRGIITPAILGSMAMRRDSARYYDQFRFRFHTTKTHNRHWLCTAAMVLMPGFSPIYDLVSAGGHPLPLEVILGAMAR
jgi:hypothetical protein